MVTLSCLSTASPCIEKAPVAVSPEPSCTVSLPERARAIASVIRAARAAPSTVRLALAVGAAVGTAVGTAVGLAVGLAVGNPVGTAVGAAVGMPLGGLVVAFAPLAPPPPQPARAS